jgi:hypothetical protein
MTKKNVANPRNRDRSSAGLSIIIFVTRTINQYATKENIETTSSSSGFVGPIVSWGLALVKRIKARQLATKNLHTLETIT